MRQVLFPLAIASLKIQKAEAMLKGSESGHRKNWRFSSRGRRLHH